MRFNFFNKMFGLPEEKRPVLVILPGCSSDTLHDTGATAYAPEIITVEQEQSKEIIPSVVEPEPVAVEEITTLVSPSQTIQDTTINQTIPKEIEKVVPKKWKRIAHHSLILFGRYYCTAKKPKCENCVLKDFCKNPLI